MSNNIKIKFISKSNTILLSGGLSNENVSVAHKKLLTILNSLECNNITFCFKELNYCDIVGIQLILSMLKSLVSKNINFNVINSSKSITDLINQHGLSDFGVLNFK